MVRRSIFAILTLALLAGAAPLRAQEAPAQEEAPTQEEARQPRAVFYMSPFAPLMGNFRGGLEVGITSNVVFEVAGLYWDDMFWRDDDLRSVSLRARYYPVRNFESFSVAFGGGISSHHDPDDQGNIETPDPVQIIGVDVAHSWLLGSNNRFNVTSAIGVVVVGPVPLLIPRLSIGYAF